MGNAEEIIDESSEGSVHPDSLPLGLGIVVGAAQGAIKISGVIGPGKTLRIRLEGSGEVPVEVGGR